MLQVAFLPRLNGSLLRESKRDRWTQPVEVDARTLVATYEKPGSRYVEDPANLLVVILRVEQYNGARGRSREILPGARSTHQGIEASTWTEPGRYDFAGLLRATLAADRGRKADHIEDSSTNQRHLQDSVDQAAPGIRSWRLSRLVEDQRVQRGHLGDCINFPSSSPQTGSGTQLPRWHTPIFRS